jgi:uncharacterized protein (TIGR03086 family)
MEQDQDLLTLYARASEWTSDKIAGATDLAAATPCEEWTLRELLNHMLETQSYFIGAARGEQASPPGAAPADVLSDDPRAGFERARADVLRVFGQEGVIEKTGPALGIAFADALLHGWDVARATGQDDRMPEGLASAAYDVIHGRFSDEQRVGVFKPEVAVAADATPQQRLLAYTGRDPS